MASLGRELVDKIRYLLLKIALPKQQYYIQCGGFHSVFHPIIHQKGEDNGTGNKNDNKQ